MTSETRRAIRRMAEQEGMSPHKIALVLGVSDYSVRWVLDHNGTRRRSLARVKQWHAQRRSMMILAQALDAMA